jgi:hypothetical protein
MVSLSRVIESSVLDSCVWPELCLAPPIELPHHPRPLLPEALTTVRSILQSRSANPAK